MAVIIQRIHAGKQTGVHGTAACQLTVLVVGLAEQAGKVVESHVARTDVEGHTGAVGIVVGDVGEAAEVETGVVLAKKEPVAYWHQGRSLSAHGHVEGAEIEHYGETRLGCNGVPVAYLCRHAQLGLVENGVAVGGHGIARPGVLLAETVDHLSEVVSQPHVDDSVFVGCGLFEGGEHTRPVLAVGVCLCGKQLESLFVNLAIGNVQSVE